MVLSYELGSCCVDVSLWFNLAVCVMSQSDWVSVVSVCPFSYVSHHAVNICRHSDWDKTAQNSAGTRNKEKPMGANIVCWITSQYVYVLS